LDKKENICVHCDYNLKFIVNKDKNKCVCDKHHFYLELYERCEPCYSKCLECVDKFENKCITCIASDDEIQN